MAAWSLFPKGSRDSALQLCLNGMLQRLGAFAPLVAQSKCWWKSGITSLRLAWLKVSSDNECSIRMTGCKHFKAFQRSSRAASVLAWGVMSDVWLLWWWLMGRVRVRVCSVSSLHAFLVCLLMSHYMQTWVQRWTACLFDWCFCFRASCGFIIYVWHLSCRHAAQSALGIAFTFVMH